MAKRMTCNKWACGSCQKQNHGNRSCDRCGTAKSSGLSLVVLPGDWRCGRCNTNNFASRKICYNSKCRQTRQFQSARLDVLNELADKLTDRKAGDSFNEQPFKVQDLNTQPELETNETKREATTSTNTEETEDDDDAILLAQL